MKKLILLIAVGLLVGCDDVDNSTPVAMRRGVTQSHTVGIVDNIHTIELEGHEYFFIGEFHGYAGMTALTHKANCKYCVE